MKGVVNYATIVLVTLLWLILSLLIQRSPVTSSHLLLMGLGAFALVRTVYMACLASDYGLSSTADFVLLTLSPLIFCMAIILMLIHWVRSFYLFYLLFYIFFIFFFSLFLF